jgi:endonuclease/exonuclease/phosphatase family metal-dependent hydrolase
MRVLSWNIRFGRGRDMRSSAHAILDTFDRLEPDLIFLQEAEQRFGRQSSLPLDALTRRGWTPVEPAHAKGLGYRGCAILLRPGLRADRAEHLPLRGFEQRGALLARIEGGPIPLSVACVHLGLLAVHRRRQTRVILDALTALPGPRAMIGDTNEWRGARRLSLPKGWHVVVTAPTFPSRRPVLTLDRACLDPSLDGISESGNLLPASMAASDHLPILVRLRARGALEG